MKELYTAGTSPDGAKQTTLSSPVADCLVQGARQASFHSTKIGNSFIPQAGRLLTSLTKHTSKTPLLQLHIT